METEFNTMIDNVNEKIHHESPLPTYNKKI